jgi:hypothetical protein
MRLSARIEGGESHFLERFAPPARNEAPAHTDKFTRAIRRNNGVDLSGRADVIARLQVGCAERQPVECNKLLPCVHSGKSAAHLCLLFNHADADIAGLLSGLRALLNRVVRNAL